MMAGTTLERARSAFERRDWQAAFDLFSEQDASDPLEPVDLDRLALAAGMLGRIPEAAEAWGRAYQTLLDDDPATAARCAFWVGMGYMQNGEFARGGGWLGRCASTLERLETEEAVHGFMLIPQGLQAIDAGELDAAAGAFEQAIAMGRRHNDADLLALGACGLGQALISAGDVRRGVTALDEAMIGVTADECSPLVTGIVYCAVILACRDAFDVRRAREWTQALDAWTEPQNGLVPFRGQCLVHRSELLQMTGSWTEALAEADRARAHLGDPPGQPAVGMAFYQLAELYRVRGAFAEAEEAYREANSYGHPPQPGLALLGLAKGEAAAAAASITTALEQSADAGHRCRLLAASVDILLAAGEADRARAAADELAGMAETMDAPFLHALCAVARARVEIASGDPTAALKRLREALTVWQTLQAPYEAAKTRVLIAGACEQLGDTATADLERDAARRTFGQLGATPDLEALDAPKPEGADGLTPREVEVLQLVATGKTNKAIASSLVISEKTVARHLSNIFTKLDLSSRAEATAYAFKRGLV